MSILKQIKYIYIYIYIIGYNLLYLYLYNNIFSGEKFKIKLEDIFKLLYPLLFVFNLNL